MAPAIAASPMTWMPGCSFDSKVTGSIGHQPVRSATPAAAAMAPARCGGMTLPTSALCEPKSVSKVLVAGSTRVTLPPSDSDTHSSRPGIQFLPRRLEQLLLGERVLGVEQEQLGARLLRLEIARDQAGAFVRTGRTAIRIGRRRDHHDAAIRHRFELAAQQQGLLAGLPGMRHAFRGGLVVAGQARPRRCRCRGTGSGGRTAARLSPNVTLRRAGSTAVASAWTTRTPSAAMRA